MEPSSASVGQQEFSPLVPFDLVMGAGKLLALAGILAVALLLVYALWRREKQARLMKSEEASRIDKMQESGRISEEEAHGLKRALGAAACIESGAAKKPDIPVKAAAILNAISAVIDILAYAVIFHICTWWWGLTALMLKMHLKPDEAAQIFSQMPSMLSLFALQVFIIFVAFAILRFAASLFLFKGATWARSMMICLSGLSLFCLPLGTFIGGFTLWTLLFRKNAAAHYNGDCD